jgi:hypothetical protein
VFRGWSGIGDLRTMGTMTNSHLSEPREAANARLQLLLEEYRALRSEVNQRIATNGALIGFATAAGAIFATGDHRGVVWWVAAAVAVLVAAVWGSNLAGLQVLSKHLRELEGLMNLYLEIAYPRDIVGSPIGLPEHIMSWETWRSLEGAGWLRRAGRALRVMSGRPA